MRLAKWTVYAIAFGVGLTCGLLLFKHAAQAPVTPGNARERVFLRAVASTPERAVTRPLALPSVATPPVTGNGKLRPDSGLSRDTVSSPRRSQPDTSAARASPSPSPRITASPPIPAHQATVPQMSSAAAPPEPDTAAQPSSYVVTPAADTPATPQPAQQSLRFHVQVGIFNTREDAQALVQRLQSLGYIATAAAGDVYRVWVGGYLDRETAERLAANLRKAGFDAALVP